MILSLQLMPNTFLHWCYTGPQLCLRCCRPPDSAVGAAEKIRPRRHGVALVYLVYTSLTNLEQTFSVNGLSSTNWPDGCSVPMGSRLGSVEFINYTEDVTTIFETPLVCRRQTGINIPSSADARCRRKSQHSSTMQCITDIGR